MNMDVLRIVSNILGMLFVGTVLGYRYHECRTWRDVKDTFLDSRVLTTWCVVLFFLYLVMFIGNISVWT